MKSDVKYDLLIIGGGISACVFASQYLKNNITKKVGLIEVGRGLGGRSSTRISKRFKGWKLNHGAPNFNISNIKNKLIRKILELIAGIDNRVQLPKYNSETFSNFFKKELPGPDNAVAASELGKSIVK